MKRLRWSVATAIALTLTAALWWRDDSLTSGLRERIQGEYTATSLDGKQNISLRFAPDGSLFWKVEPPGPSKSAVLRRWWISGRKLTLDEGAAALAPLGVADFVEARFAKPLLGNPTSKLLVVSADESGLLLNIGRDIASGRDVTWKLNRKPSPRASGNAVSRY